MARLTKMQKSINTWVVVMCVMCVTAVVMITILILETNQMNRELDALVDSLNEIEELTIQLEKESGALLKEVEELYSE